MVHVCYLRFTKTLVLLIILLCAISLFSLTNRKAEDVPIGLEDFKYDIGDVKLVAAAPLFSTVGEFVYLPQTSKPCNTEFPKVLVVVQSSSGHVVHRSAIRQTWGKVDKHLKINLRTVFVVGQSTAQMVNQRTLQEAKVHGDLVLVKLMDTYKNMSLKHLAGLNWALSNCAKVPFVMKVDDDAFVDMKRVMDTLEVFLGEQSASSDALVCQTIVEGSSPKRLGKWAVTKNEYHHLAYPEYCSGLAYFTKMTTVAKIYDAAMFGNVPYLWIDDVFVTGLAAGFANIKRVDIGMWFANNELQIIDWLKNGVAPCPWMVAELSIAFWPSNAFLLWNKTKKVWMNNDTWMTI